MSPYFEYQPWVLADQLGLDEEQGIDLQFTTYDSTDKAVVAAYRGDIDIASNCMVCTFSLIGQAPEIQDFMITNQFKGFIVIGRQGEAVSFAELEGSVGPEQAKEQVLDSLRGKTFAIRSSSYAALLSSALAQVGMSLDDIEITDFPTDAQAALAFMGGTGDYYIGSLPQEAKLLEEPDKYVNVGGTDVLGPAGLWFSSMAASTDWLDENSDTVDRLLAIWYRTMTYMDQDPDTTIPMFADAINEAAASDLSDETVGTILSELENFATADAAASEFYEPSSPTYFGTSIAFYEEENKDKLPAGYDRAATYSAAEYFENFQQNQELVDWVDAPIE